MVDDMKPGSVIVDLAAAGGGNCALTKKGEVTVTKNGVTIIGYDDLPGRMAGQSSMMYANNMMNLLGHVAGKDKVQTIFGVQREAIWTILGVALPDLNDSMG